MQAWIAGFQDANPDATIVVRPGRLRRRSRAVRRRRRRLRRHRLGARRRGADRRAGALRRRRQPGRDPGLHLADRDHLQPRRASTTCSSRRRRSAKIFKQKITNWNDPAIAADNPDADAARARASPSVNRSDESGTTENFTDYLSQTAPDVWTYEPDDDWPVKGGEAAQGTSGVVDAVKTGKGTIGYADESQAGELGIAKIKVGDDVRRADAPRRRPKVVERLQGDRRSGPVRVHVRRSTAPRPTAGDVPDRPRLLPDRLHQVRRRRPGRARQGLPATTSISAEGQDAAAKNAGSAPITRRAAHEDPAGRRRDRRRAEPYRPAGRLDAGP